MKTGHIILHTLSRQTLYCAIRTETDVRSSMVGFFPFLLIILLQSACVGTYSSLQWIEIGNIHQISQIFKYSHFIYAICLRDHLFPFVSLFPKLYVL